MRLYAAIDLHSNNSVLVVLDQKDKVVYEHRHPNDLPTILAQLKPHKKSIQAIAVESTYNWYWLVDGLMEAGYEVKLVNTVAVKTYDGLKYSSDEHDARHLAHLLRLGILPTAYIYPKEERAVRDLLRKRAQLVRDRTTHILSVQNLITRNSGKAITQAGIRKLDEISLGLYCGVGHEYNSWWTGTILDIHESRELVPHQNATTVQVAIGVISAAMWMMQEIS